MENNIKARRGNISGIPVLVIGLVVAAILIGSILVSSVGLLANATKGTNCVNCQATTKTLLQNTELFIVLAVMLGIIGAGIAAFTLKGRK